MSEHTTGPWHTGGIFDPLGPIPTTNVYGKTPAGKQSGLLLASRLTLDDGRLIAAAPELLARSGTAVLSRVTAAISKAEGRS